ncbi:MAG: hypothetical protein EVA65_00940 [Oceanococcus sp.]|nr:MAG: hypothetical protein EVA65_00940 [Oceanococcus sp.]
MSDLPEELIREATRCLTIRDIILHEARFERGDLVLETGNAFQQHKLQTKFGVSRQDGAEDGNPDLLQVMVMLGTQVVPTQDADQRDFLFRIEADFVAEYSIDGCPSDESVQAFAKYNAVHNVWPFWRQHLFDVVNRARLPQLAVPLMSGVKPKPLE